MSWKKVAVFSDGFRSANVISTFRLCYLAAALALFGCGNGVAQRAAVFKAGVATRDITPKEPVPMWGYGARHDALSTGTLDPLRAVALVIQAGPDKLAIVGLDLGRAPTEQQLEIIRQRIKAEAGIGYSFIAGSHTHHGPVLELTDAPGKGKGKFDAALRYYREMEDAIAAAVIEANHKIAPAKLAVGSVKLEGFNRNRQSKIEPKPSDRDLEVMRFDGLDGKPLAIVVNFSGHPTMIPARTLKFSADYVGMMKETVSTELQTTTIFMQGAAGDQSVNPGTNSGYQAFGRALGQEVVKLARSLSPAEVTKPSLTVKEDRFKFSSRTDLSDPVVRMAYSFAFFRELIPNYADDDREGVDRKSTRLNSSHG